jgi:hypothetical protein
MKASLEILIMTEKVYIPLTAKTLTAVLRNGTDALKNTSVDQTIGLLALQNLPAMKTAAGALEQGLYNLFNALKIHTIAQQLELLRAHIIKQLDQEKIKAAAKIMYESGVMLIHEETIKNRSYLNTEGDWDFTFSQWYSPHAEAETSKVFPLSDFISTKNSETGFLTEAQARIISTIKADIDEPLAVQGYAGVGKTYIVKALLEMLQDQGIKPLNVLILAQTRNQYHALLKNLPKGYRGMTFGMLATKVLPDEFYRFKHKPEQIIRMDYNRLISYYNFTEQAGLSASTIAHYCYMTLKNYCESADDRVSEKHLPYAIKNRTSGGWQECNILKEHVIKAAQDLWLKTVDISSTDLIIPIRDYHRIKLAALLDRQIPAYITHAIIDESHDLTQAMIQFIDSNQTCNCITLGDAYQNFNGVDYKRSETIRKTQINESYRAGNGIAELVNPVVQTHPFGQSNAVFRGNTKIYTAVEYYKTAKVPTVPTAILCSNDWACWEWVQRVSNGGGDFECLSNLDHFVKDAINLFIHDIRATHVALSNYSDWSSLYRAYKSNATFKRIHEMLDQGYSFDDWQNTTKKLKPSSKKPKYIIGKAESSRNREFDRLMLSPDIIDLVGKDTMGPGQRARLNSILYVAITRARYELLAPLSLREWIEEINGRQLVIEAAKK